MSGAAILLSLLLQAAAPAPARPAPARPAPTTPAPPRAPAAAPTPAAPSATPPTPRPSAGDALKPIDSAVAIDAFKSLCWAAFRDPAAFREAVVQAPLALTPVPRGDASAQQGELYRSEEALLTYVASDSLPASIPSRQCSLRVRLAGGVDQLSLAARVATALGLPSGRTRSGPALSMTQWDVVGSDQRTTRLFAVTGSGARGGTDLRLSVLLLGKQP